MLTLKQLCNNNISILVNSSIEIFIVDYLVYWIH
nr:MAG TPA: hypothetical protein [Caudoviricetes sp.]